MTSGRCGAHSVLCRFLLPSIGINPPWKWDWLSECQINSVHRVVTWVGMYCCDGYDNLYGSGKDRLRERRIATADHGKRFTAVRCTIAWTVRTWPYQYASTQKMLWRVARLLQTTVRCCTVTRNLNNTYRDVSPRILHRGFVDLLSLCNSCSISSLNSTV